MHAVNVDLRIANLADEGNAVVVRQALVEPASLFTRLPADMIRDLCLIPNGRLVPLRDGDIRTGRIHASVRIGINGRDCATDVVEDIHTSSVVVGRLTLLELDLVLGEAGNIVGNPAHGGEWIVDMY